MARSLLFRWRVAPALASSTSLKSGSWLLLVFEFDEDIVNAIVEVAHTFRVILHQGSSQRGSTENDDHHLKGFSEVPARLPKRNRQPGTTLPSGIGH